MLAPRFDPRLVSFPSIPRSRHLSRLLGLSIAAVLVVFTGCRGRGGSSLLLPSSNLSVVETVPPDGASDVAIESAIRILFDSDIDPASVSAETIRLEAHRESGQPAEARPVGYRVDGATVILEPAEKLVPGVGHEIVVTDGVRDRQQRRLTSDLRVRFVTKELEPFRVSKTFPTDGAGAVETDIVVSVSFTRPVDPASITPKTFQLLDAEKRITGELEVSGRTVFLTPDRLLPEGAEIEAHLSASVSDVEGHSLAEAYTWGFRTVESVPPAVESVDPAVDAEDVPAGTIVTAVFSEAIAAETVTSETFLLRDSSGATIPGELAVDESTATFSPRAPFVYRSRLTAKLTTGIEDLSGSHLTEDFEWSFQVERRPAVLVEHDDSGTASGPSIARAPAGGAVAVWSQQVGIDQGGDGRHSLYARSYDGTLGAWDPAGPRSIEPFQDGSAIDVEVATDALGNAIAVWTQFPEGADSITYAVRYDAASAQWDPTGPVRLPPDGMAGRSILPTIAIDAAGNALAVWIHVDDGPALWARAFDAGQKTWGSAQELSSEAALDSIEAPRTAPLLDGSFLVTWGQLPSLSEADVWWARFHPASGWQSAGPLDSGSGGAATPRIASDASGDAFVVWHQDVSKPLESPRLDVFARRFDGAADAWQATIRLDTDDHGWARHADVAMDGAGNAIAVWTQDLVPGADGDFDVYAQRYDAVTSRWSSTGPVRLSDAQLGNVFEVRIVSDGQGRFATAWDQVGTFQERNVFGAFFEGSQWGEPLLLQNDEAAASSIGAAVTLGPQALPFVVWAQSGGTVDSIWANRIDKTQ